MKKFNKLSRAEMKHVLGGLCRPGDPNCAGQGSCSYFGSCTNWPVSSTYDPDNVNQATIQQIIADTFCEANDCCTNADCPGAATV